MGDCKIPYIPERLHRKDRGLIEEFYNDELLYRRSKKSEVNSPFQITLTDLSVNRQGAQTCILSEADDVLFSLDLDDENVTYIGMEVVKMKVLNVDNQYKTYRFVDGPVKMQLLHNPLDCNYSHSVFRVWYNDQIITFGNWNESLGVKSARGYRTLLRNELGKMIIREVELNV